MTGTEEKPQSKPLRARVGTVRSISGNKTINVVVNTLVKHQRYGKYIRRRTTLAVHDPSCEAIVGDMVEIVPIRRLSKSKSWRMRRVVKRSLATESE
ncbi:MAG: small ribosomal subunit protein uS17 [Planctomycetota bacterium]|jgi:small subunit ribosomal protein S17